MDDLRWIRAAAEPTSLRIQGASEGFELLGGEQDGEGKPKLRRFSMTAYTGGAMSVGFGYPVVVDLEGMQVPSQARPVLMAHDMGRIVGHSTAVDITQQRLKISGVISGVGEDAQNVVALAANGFPWQASIGASVGRMEFVDRGETVKVNGRTFQGPVNVARATVLGEISFVALGADGNSSAAVAAGHQREGNAVTFEQWLQARGFDPAALSDGQRTYLRAQYDADQRPAPPPPPVAQPVQAAAPAATTPPPTPAADPAAELRAQAARELERQGTLRRIAAQYPGLEIELPAEGATPARRVDLHAHALAENWTPEQYELRALRESRPRGPWFVIRDHERDCNAETLQAAVMLRAGVHLDRPAYQTPSALALDLPRWLRQGINAEQRQRVMETAHRFSHLSAVDLCREACRLDAREAPLERGALIRAAFSGSTLTNIFTTSVNAQLLATYMEAGDTTGGWTSETEVADFKTNERPRMAKGPNLVKLPRGGEADHYNRSDLVESYKIARYAKQFVVDEQDVIDDALGALGEMPREMGLAAARLRPDLVYAIILRNAALGADSIALFHASHSNLNTSSALSHATLKTAIAAMEKMQENSVNLNLRVSHVLVPSDLKHLAAELIKSTTIAYGADDETVRGTQNTIATDENITLVSDARLSNGVTDPVDDSTQSGSTSTWYLASRMGHTIEVAYLRGTGRAPQVRPFTLSQGKWGMGWDVCLDIGAKALDYRGLAKCTQ